MARSTTRLLIYDLEWGGVGRLNEEVKEKNEVGKLHYNLLPIGCHHLPLQNPFLCFYYGPLKGITATTIRLASQYSQSDSTVSYSSMVSKAKLRPTQLMTVQS